MSGAPAPPCQQGAVELHGCWLPETAVAATLQSDFLGSLYKPHSALPKYTLACLALYQSNEGGLGNVARQNHPLQPVNRHGDALREQSCIYPGPQSHSSGDPQARLMHSLGRLRRYHVLEPNNGKPLRVT